VTGRANDWNERLKLFRTHSDLSDHAEADFNPASENFRTGFNRWEKMYEGNVRSEVLYVAIFRTSLSNHRWRNARPNEPQNGDGFCLAPTSTKEKIAGFTPKSQLTTPCAS
jgi:hypothetical protein